MPLKREFLDWRQPALAGAADFLRSRHEQAGELDLRGAIVVVPAGRAGRRLLEILVGMSDERNLVLAPPKIVTPDAFPELLYEPKRPFADMLTQQLAWTEALRTALPESLAPVLPLPPPYDDTQRWMAIGQTLRRLHLELAADGLDCGDVLKRAASVPGFDEHRRWQTLSDLEQKYLRILDRLQLWDVQTARLVAIEKREIATEKQIVLLGTV